MTLNEILTAMQNWQNACNQQGLQTIQDIFAKFNMFSFEPDMTNKPVTGQGGAYVHFYPGINNGDFVIFSIGAFYDSPSFQGSILDHISICTPGQGQPSPETQQSGITWKEASERIDLWEINSQAWINANIGSMYNAFVMPQNDGATGSKHNAFFALKPGTTLSNMVPDLIVEDIEGSSISYFDTVLIIPPMAPSGVLAPANFYLLSLT